jgi:two-component system invasion response regulator UvrY
MPGLDGIAAATIIRRQNSDARIVLVTVHSERLMVEAGLSAGALGYVLKDTAGDDLVAAVRSALDGQRYVSKELSHLEPRNE